MKDYRQFPAAPDFLAPAILRLYQHEEGKWGFVKMKLRHLFFENGIWHHYQVAYLETLCTLLKQVSTRIFAIPIYPTSLQKTTETDRLVHFALLPDVEMLFPNRQFYVLIFPTREAYEVCANISYLHL